MSPAVTLLLSPNQHEVGTKEMINPVHYLHVVSTYTSPYLHVVSLVEPTKLPLVLHSPRCHVSPLSPCLCCIR